MAPDKFEKSMQLFLDGGSSTTRYPEEAGTNLVLEHKSSCSKD